MSTSQCCTTFVGKFSEPDWWSIEGRLLAFAEHHIRVLMEAANNADVDAMVALRTWLQDMPRPGYLGHGNAGFTLRVYGHLMPSAADAVRSAMDASLAECATAAQDDLADGTS